MRSKHIFSILKRSIAILLSLLMLLTLIGCSEQDVTDALEIAEALLDVSGASDTADEYTDVPNTGDPSPPQNEHDTTFDDTVTETSAADVTFAEETTDKELYETASLIDEDGYYYSRDDVALYIHTYGKLPSNFITKAEAEDLGWEGGSVEYYLEGAAIGGSVFGNREGLLPKKKGRTYYECDIDTDGAKPRGAKRIVYSNDGLIYYTDDHYESFILLYGEEQETV